MAKVSHDIGRRLNGQPEWLTVTPGTAAKILETMPVNRRLSQGWVESLAYQMKQGAWDEGLGDPIRFNEKNELIDGQHRMWAVVESGCTVKMIVMRGLSGESLLKIDYGRRRSIGDHLHILGEDHAADLAAALVYFNEYLRTGELLNRSWGVQPLTPVEAVALLNEHPGIRNSLPPADTVRKRLGGGRARWTAMHYILSSVDYDDAVAFFEMLATGVGMTNESPVAHLRNRLIEQRGKTKAMRVRDYSAHVFKAWNLYRDGDSVRVLTWRPGGAHPEQYPVPH